MITLATGGIVLLASLTAQAQYSQGLGPGGTRLTPPPNAPNSGPYNYGLGPGGTRLTPPPNAPNPGPYKYGLGPGGTRLTPPSSPSPGSGFGPNTGFGSNSSPGVRANTPSTAAPSARRGYYGAIAVSRETGAIGWAYDYATQVAAERAATTQCGTNDCTSWVWFRRACAAVAWAGNAAEGGSWAWAGTHQAAEASALRGCEKTASGCAVHRWVCTTR